MVILNFAEKTRRLLLSCSARARQPWAMLWKGLARKMPLTYSFYPLDWAKSTVIKSHDSYHMFEVSCVTCGRAAFSPLESFRYFTLARVLPIFVTVTLRETSLFNPKLANMASLGLSCAWNVMEHHGTVGWRRRLPPFSGRPSVAFQCHRLGLRKKLETQACPQTWFSHVLPQFPCSNVLHFLRLKSVQF